MFITGWIGELAFALFMIDLNIRFWSAIRSDILCKEHWVRRGTAQRTRYLAVSQRFDLLALLGQESSNPWFF